MDSAAASGTTAEAPRGDPRGPRPGRRGRLLVVAIIAVVALLYGTVVTLYALGGQVTDSGIADVPADADAVVFVRPQTVDAAGDRIGLTLDLQLGERLTSGAAVAAAPTATLLVSAAVGNRTLEYPAGGVLSPTSVSLITDGLIEQWPFDAHTARTTFVVYRVVAGEIEVVPTYLVAEGRVPGWSIDARSLEPQRALIDGQEVMLPVIEVTATRAGSTVAFGLVLLALMIVMPVVVLVVAISAYRGRRKVEPTFLGWIAAMLFATIPMRTFLPGSPPIGSWIDFLLVLWVFAGLIAGLIVIVLAWLKWSSRPDRP